MPVIIANKTRITYTDDGNGPPVVMAMGTGSPGHAWHLYQVPALVDAGYRVITFDNRGLSSGDAAAPTINDIVADIVALIETLCGGSASLVGVSMGSHAIQELLLLRPDLANRAVLMATRGRPDAFRSALASAQAALSESDVKLPAAFEAAMRALQYLSPRTLDDESHIRQWLDLFEMFPASAAIARSQAELENIQDRITAYQDITTQCLVVAFEHDVITPPHLNREVAVAIPGCHYHEITGCGHYGYMERPDEVNSLIIAFLRALSPRP